MDRTSPTTLATHVQGNETARPEIVSPSLDRMLELMVVFVLATSMAGLVLALGGLFQALQVVLLGAMSTLAYAFRFPASDRHRQAPNARHLLLLALVVLFFRIPSFNYVLGGQDEGVYFNIAANMVRTGGIVPTDAVLARISNTAQVQQYVSENYQQTIYLPGVYRSEDAVPQSEFQFYHMFPMWMAIAGGLFGIFNQLYALTFLSLLSVIFIYALALRISGKAEVALAAGLLLAVNPLHVFFSKFSVSEVPTLAFSAIGFAMLAGYWSAPTDERRPRWLVLSALAFACLFTTRISGFMYLPFLLAVSIASLLCDPDRPRARALHLWGVGVAGLYALSVAYGLRWSSHYSTDIYELSFRPLLGAHWKRVAALAVAAMIAAWGVMWTLSISRWRPTLARAVLVASRLVGPLTLLCIAAALYKGYQLGFTDLYLGDPWMATRWHLAGAGWRSFGATSLIVAAMYLGPPLFVAYLWLVQRRSGAPMLQMLSVFLLGFAANFALLQWFVAYQPYFARYLLSEFVPYIVLFVCCAWGATRSAVGKSTILAVILLSGVYAVAVSAAQYGKRENAGAQEFLSRATSHLGAGDVLMMDATAPPYGVSAVKTGIVYAFGKAAMNVNATSLMDDTYIARIAAAFDDVYLLTAKSSTPAGFDFVETERLQVAGFDHSLHPPVRASNQLDLPLYLYRLHASYGNGSVIDFGSGGAGVGWLGDGWSTPEPWGVWSIGHSAHIRIASRDLIGAEDLKLRLTAIGFVGPSHPRQVVRMAVNAKPGTTIEFRYPDATSQTIEIAIGSGGVGATGAVDVAFDMPDAVSPRALGRGGDDRTLAIGLKSAVLVAGE